MEANDYKIFTVQHITGGILLFFSTACNDKKKITQS